MARPSAIVPVAQDQVYINWLNYGEPGVGKSALLGTSPKCLVLANDNDETSTVARFGRKADKWIVDDYDELERAYEYLRQEGWREYDWMWFDNVTLFQEQGMDQIMEELVAKKPGRNRYVPDQHEYLVNQNHLALMIRNLKSLPMHCGFTAHVFRTEDDDGKVVYLPLIQGGQGALAQKLCGYMNLVTYMHTAVKDGKIERRLLTDKRQKYYAKDRWHSLGGLVVNPTVPKVTEAIRANVPNLGQRQATRPAATPAKKATAKKATATKRTATTRRAS